MTKDEIIRMAREAGFREPNPHDGFMGLAYDYRDDTDTGASLERFAALVAAHVRETEFKPDWNNYRQGLADGAAEEREACAKVCDALNFVDNGTPAGTRASNKHCAAAIRARGETSSRGRHDT